MDDGRERLMRSVVLAAVLTAVLLAGIARDADAQTGTISDTLRIMRIDTSAAPKIRVYVRTYCNARIDKSLSTLTVDVHDNDLAKTFSISCPPESVPMSVALCLDNSGSVSGTSLFKIMEAAYRFVELFQPHATGTDEGAVITFNDRVSLDVPMTTSQTDLYNAILNLYGAGTTALWDGVIMALNEVATGSHNPIRAVVVLSDGGDNSSNADLPDVIQFARSTGIPIYSLCLIYHAEPSDVAAMKRMADSTGGMFLPLYTPNDIIPAFEAIASLVTGGANECMIEYRIDCADGALHTVNVTAQACGKTVSATTQYRAPLDPGLPSVTLDFDSSQAYENGDLFIPVRITARGAPADITSLRFRVLRYDSVSFVRAITAGHFAEQFSVDAHELSDTLFVDLAGNATLTGSDTLLVLQYRLSRFDRDSVLPFRLFFLDKNTRNCMQLLANIGPFSVLVRPKADPACTDSISVRWDAASGSYEPGVFTASTTVTNRGTARALNTRAWITLPYGLQLDAGRDTVFLNTINMAPGASERVEFRVRVLPTDSARRFPICITVQPDSGYATTCCTTVDIERGRPALRAWCSMPAEIRWSDSLQSYVPKSFTVTLGARNISAVAARGVEAWIHVPPGFVVSPMTPINTTLAPSTLLMNDTGSVTWLVTPLDRPTSDTVEFCIKAAAGLDTTVCCQRVFITSTPVRAAVACGNARVIRYDDDTKTFDPPQLIVGVLARNVCGIDMAQAQGRITLPSFLKLAPGETPLKDFPKGAVIAPGDSAQLTWNLVAWGTPTENSQICIDILASNYPGGRCCIPVTVVTNAQVPVLQCALSGPDTIRYDASAYHPNPFTLQLAVTNVGSTAAKNVYAALLQGADLSIDSTDQALKKISDSLAAGGTASSSFRIKVLPRKTARLDTIRVSVYGANGGATVCDKVVYIEAVRGPILTLACSGPDSLAFSDTLQSYVPSPFTVSITATNTGTAPADSIVAEFLPPSGITLATGDRPAKPLQPPTLNPGEQGTASWQVVAGPHTAPSIDTMHVQVRAKGGLLEEVRPCLLTLRVPAVREPSLSIACFADTLTLNGARYEPDPFTVTVTVTNAGDADAFDAHATLLGFGSLQHAPSDSVDKTRPVVRARNGRVEFTWRFSAAPSAQLDSADVCVRVSARGQGDMICCARVMLPPLPDGDITVRCSAPDTVRWDPATGGYPNPIVVRTTVTNPTQRLVDSVRATLILPQGMQCSSGETPDKTILALAPSQSAPLQWNVDVLRDTATTPLVRTLRIQYYASGGVKTCDMTVVVMPPPQQRDSLAMAVTCTAPDSIRYINSQIGLQPSPFTARVDIENTGSLPVGGVRATLTLPADITFASGESSTKALGAPLPPGQRASISWSCVPALTGATHTPVIRMRVEADSLPAATCDASIVIDGISRDIQLSIPTGNVVRTGQTISIPVLFSNPTAALVNSFAFTIRYKPQTVQIMQIDRAGTLTDAWNLAASWTAPGRIRVQGASPVALAGSGTLFTFVLRAVSGDGTDAPLAVDCSPLAIDSTVFPSGITVSTRDGDVCTTGDCLIPLNAGAGYALLPNRPNPFNPSTILSYVIPRPMAGLPLSLDIYDTFGRMVSRVADGYAAEGTHEVRFDADGLPGGVYVAVLTVGGTTLSRSMLLVK